MARNHASLSFAGIVLSVTAGYAQAAVSVHDAAALAKALEEQPPCCVVDARGTASQRRLPIADAVRYRPGLRIVAAAPVVVVGDGDREASKAAEALARQHPSKEIYVLAGGAAAWESVRRTLETPRLSKRADAGSPAISFVIPHNTCETGTPLQILQSKPKARQ